MAKAGWSQHVQKQPVLSVVEMEDSLVGETAEGVRSEGRRPGSPAASAVSSAPVR